MDKSVKIENHTYKKLKDYSRKTGINIKFLINQALEMMLAVTKKK